MASPPAPECFSTKIVGPVVSSRGGLSGSPVQEGASRAPFPNRFMRSVAVFRSSGERASTRRARHRACSGKMRCMNSIPSAVRAA